MYAVLPPTTRASGEAVFATRTSDHQVTMEQRYRYTEVCPLFVFLEILLVNSHPRSRLPIAISNFADNLSQYAQAVDSHDSGDSISTLQPIFQI